MLSSLRERAGRSESVRILMADKCVDDRAERSRRQISVRAVMADANHHYTIAQDQSATAGHTLRAPG